MKTTKRRLLRVVERKTGKVEHSIDVTGRSERVIERIEMGLLINLDAERFFVEDDVTEAS